MCLVYPLFENLKSDEIHIKTFEHSKIVMMEGFDCNILK